MTAESGRISIADASVRIDSMPAEGRDIALSASDEDRAAIAAQLGLTSIERLEAKLHAVKFRGGIRVTGRLDAVIVQPSVVSLQPVRQIISEPVDRVFLPGSEKPFAGAAGAEVFVDLEGEDIPDHFDGPEADLSNLIIETLSLAVDPYPKAEGEHLEDLGIVNDADEPESPFAVLKKLRKGPGEGA